MGTPTVSNIIVGGAVLWYAPAGEDIPDESTVALGDAWGGDWERVGYTKAPLALAYSAEYGQVQVEEFLGMVKQWRIDEMVSLETELAELTAGYLKLVLGGAVTTTNAGAGQVAFEELKQGGEVFLTDYTVGAEGTYIDATGNKFPVRIIFHRANIKMNGNLEFTNRNNSFPGIPILIESLGDSSKPVGEQRLVFQRVTAAASS